MRVSGVTTSASSWIREEGVRDLNKTHTTRGRAPRAWVATEPVQLLFAIAAVAFAKTAPPFSLERQTVKLVLSVCTEVAATAPPLPCVHTGDRKRQGSLVPCMSITATQR